MKHTCLYQGIKGSFSYMAALKWDSQLQLMGKRTFREVFETLLEVDFAIIPLENSLAGSIYENYDLLQEFPVEILGEVYQKIDHCLLSVGEDLSQIKEVFSHPKALEQCGKFFRDHPWMEKEVDFDTAGAAAKISTQKNPRHGAIASKMAGEIYGLHILNENIQDIPENVTRFALITRQVKQESSPNKASFLFHLPHEVGALLKVLELFSAKGANLTKIESRPYKLKPFEYVFYADCQVENKEVLEELSQELKAKTSYLKVLGFYQAGALC